MTADGSRVGMLLARGGRPRFDAIVVCLAADGDDILTSGPGDLRALAGGFWIDVGLIPSEPGSPIRTTSAGAGPRLHGLSDGGCFGVAG